jgi:hypothetical protein
MRPVTAESVRLRYPALHHPAPPHDCIGKRAQICPGNCVGLPARQEIRVRGPAARKCFEHRDCSNKAGVGGRPLRYRSSVWGSRQGFRRINYRRRNARRFVGLCRMRSPDTTWNGQCAIPASSWRKNTECRETRSNTYCMMNCHRHCLKNYFPRVKSTGCGESSIRRIHSRTVNSNSVPSPQYSRGSRICPS